MSVWYVGIQLDEELKIIKDNFNNISRSFVSTGYYLKDIRDRELFTEMGYTDIWELAEKELGVSKSTASRLMAINDRFSVDGNSPILLDKYKDFSSSKLSEMLTLTDSQLEQVKPDMTRKEIREMKPAKEKKTKSDVVAPAQQGEVLIDDLDLSIRTYNTLIRAGIDTVKKLKEQTDEDLVKIRNMSKKQIDEIKSKLSTQTELSAKGIEMRVYPPDSLINTPGCGNADCFSCGHNCNTRAENRYCILATMGHPFDCSTIKIFDSLLNDLGDQCMFINLELAHKKGENGESEPCCRDCENKNLCGYACNKSKDKLDHEIVVDVNVVDEKCNEDEEQKALSPDIKSLMDDPYCPICNKSLTYRCDCECGQRIDWSSVAHLFEYEEEQIQKRIELLAKERLKNITTEQEQKDFIQPELPILKNNDQRKAWLEQYQSWPLWTENELTQERFFKYNFDNGESIVIKEVKKHPYIDWKTGYSKDVKWTQEQCYLIKPDKLFKECEVNMSYLVDYLKDYQKK